MALSVEQMTRLVFRQVAPTMRRAGNMIKRGVIRRVNDSGAMQRLQLSLLAHETADSVEHLQPFGLSFHPPTGSEVVALAVGGNSDHLFALGATSRDHRPTGVEEGEGGLYTLTGWKVLCDADGNVYLGGDASGATHKVARADEVEARITEIVAPLVATPAVPQDGGKTLQEALISALTTAGWTGMSAPAAPSNSPVPPEVGSSKVKVVE